MARRAARSIYWWADSAMTVLLVTICIFLCYHVSLKLLWIYIAHCVVITLVCPILFIRLQKYKKFFGIDFSEIKGPWDEAVMHLD
jgi:hypothetical protein